MDVDPDCGIGDFAAALGRTKPASAPGSEYAYSSLGADLAAMARTHGTALANDSVLRPALAEIPRLSDLTEHPNQGQRLYGWRSGTTRRACPAWRRPIHWESRRAAFWVRRTRCWTCFGHCGSIPGSPLAAALRLATTPRAGASEGNPIGLFWHVGCVRDSGGQQATWHNGRLPGYRSFLGFMPEHQIAVVVLSNAAKPVDELGGGLLAAPVH